MAGNGNFQLQFDHMSSYWLGSIPVIKIRFEVLESAFIMLIECCKGQGYLEWLYLSSQPSICSTFIWKDTFKAYLQFCPYPSSLPQFCILLYIGTTEGRMFLIYNSFLCCHSPVDGIFQICQSNSLGASYIKVHRQTTNY